VSGLPRFADRVAVVTGGGRGIGRAVCLRLAAEGARVVVADLDEALALEAAGSVRAAGGEAVAIPMDIADAASCEATVRAALDAFGALDVLVNNAGRLLGENRQTLETLDAAEWDRMVDVNLRGTYLMSRAAARPMIEGRRGAVVCIGSMAAARFGRDGIAYNVSKAGVHGLVGSLAIVLAPHGIRVNGVAPGILTTRSRPDLDEIRGRIPLRKFATPEDVAASVAFLASEDAGHVTGQILFVDGGVTAARPW
jgi:3-oxoacyl-[acyl-carrier protein] reductase